MKTILIQSFDADGRVMYMNHQQHWTHERMLAKQFLQREVEKAVAEVNKRNRYLDPEDRIQTFTTEIVS